jgi:ribose transport system permease protein
LTKFFREQGALIALIVLFIINAIWQRGIFLQPENLANIVAQSSYVGILAVGMTLVIIGGGIDLSVGSILALSATLSILSLNKAAHDPSATFLAILVGIASGTAVGFINGVVITWGRIAPFIATLSGLIAFRSIALAITEARQVTTSSKMFGTLSQEGLPTPFKIGDSEKVVQILWPVVAFFVLAAVGSFILNRTIYGRRLIATGANEQAAIYSGIATHRVKWTMYAILGFCCGVASIFKAAQLNSVSAASIGQYFELDAIAAAVIGGTSLAGGRGQVWKTVYGVLILGLINNMLNLSGINANWQGCFKGVIILLAVLIQRGDSKK